MKKTKDNSSNEKKSSAEQPKLKPFFFPSLGRSVMAASMSEAKRLVLGKATDAVPQEASS